jgi:predicted NUDIX family phosphoesterase
MIGGYSNRDELEVNISEDFKINMLRELREELDISEQDLNAIKFLGVLETEKGSVNIFFKVNTSLSKQEVEKRYEKIIDKEFQSLIFIDEKDIKEYLDSKIDGNKVISHVIVTNI